MFKQDVRNLLQKQYFKKSFIASQKFGILQATAYRNVRQAQAGTLHRKQGSGRRPKIATKMIISKIVKCFKNKSGCSQRNVEKKFGISQCYVSKILKRKTNIRAFKKEKRPQRDSQQKKDIRPKCRKLYQLYKNYDFLMDDESFFTSKNSKLSGNNIYYALRKVDADDKVRFKTVQKFPEKLLVSICISPKGVSPIYIHQSKQAIDSRSYISILKQTLLPLISEYYNKNSNYVFWPDKASAHYSKDAQTFLKRRKIKYVEKKNNPTNLPEARPIENFWGDLKRLVYSNDWQAKNLLELEARIRQCYSKMNNNIYLNQVQNLKTKLNNIAQYGL